MKKRILVVDDQLAMRNMFKKILHGADFDIDLAEDGMIAYKAATAKHYDLIISDYRMPNLNGIELTQKLRQLSAYTGVPILIVSTTHNEKTKISAKQAGATGWFTKPIDRADLLPILNKLLKTADV